MYQGTHHLVTPATIGRIGILSILLSGCNVTNAYGDNARIIMEGGGITNAKPHHDPHDPGCLDADIPNPANCP